MIESEQFDDPKIAKKYKKELGMIVAHNIAPNKAIENQVLEV